MAKSRQRWQPDDYLGLIPAAGHARRLGRQSQSKELLPVIDIEAHPPTRIPVCEYLLRQYRQCGITQLLLLRRAEKADLADYFARLPYADLNIVDCVIESTPDTSHTLDQAWPMTRHRPAALGYPDMIVQPKDIYTQLIKRQQELGSDVCVSLLPAGDPRTFDIVEYRGDTLLDLHIKPGTQANGHRSRDKVPMTWGCAVWLPSFSAFLHDYLANTAFTKEVYVGEPIREALRSGLSVAVVPFPNGTAHDIGTPSDLALAQHADFLGGLPHPRERV